MLEACKRLGSTPDLFDQLRREVCLGPLENSISMLGLESGCGISPWLESLQLASGHDDLWSQTIVVGHSQGAGHALWLSKTRLLRGVVMISGPADSYNSQLALWTQQASVTPANRMLALVHAQDSGFSAIVKHCCRSGLAPIHRRDLEIDNEGGLLLVDSEPVPLFSAHGCLAGPQTWSLESDRFPIYSNLLDRCLGTWQSHAPNQPD